jgi:hypothetical protein
MADAKLSTPISIAVITTGAGFGLIRWPISSMRIFNSKPLFMTRINPLIPAVFIALSLLSSCKKAYDYIEDHPNTQSPCRIINYRMMLYGGTQYNFVVTYNQQGNPITMMDSDRVHAVGNDQYFRYDKLNRLSDYMIAYAPNLGAIEWHKYVYPRPDYIIDTVMFYQTGLVTGPSPTASNLNEYRISAYTLDRFDRIEKVWSIPNDSPHTPSLQSTIVYDANGNLPLPPESIGEFAYLGYDDKVNMFRTNKVWQFVYQDYSANNIIIQDDSSSFRYNAFGLPVNLINFTPYQIYPFDEYNPGGPEVIVDYACSLPKGPVDY